ncbi:MAG: hypothetical protein KA109_11670 [Saprospiraceae bacterium]|jgi:ligand-binding sensor domain-containing protein|nr:hypothetical protein [Saprospiraceae bacterium]MBK6481132.1 hypothetical protein [Saprospiraceae bacterium]MBK6815465.1 hypothetical protein [Saprospiraceae bacterium]MBK9677582.1 hypothetical protein [Saprospiraceae bacterium]MBP7802273.1 hypothetical protein [Saprospiraceae bacterium]
MNIPKVIFFLTILTLLTSCNGQATTQSEISTNSISIGDTVNELGKEITLVYQDKKDNYWFASKNDGVYKYDEKIIIHFTTKDGLTSNSIGEIKEDKSGNIYFTTDNGICKFNGKIFIALKEKVGVDNDWKLNPNDIWFKSPEYDGFVYRYDGENLLKLQVPKIKIGEEYISKHPNYANPYAVFCIYTDSKVNVWFGTATLGAFRYNGKSFDWIIEDDVTELHDGPANGVRSIIEDKNGDFWFNSAYRYTIYEDTLIPKNGRDKSSFYKRTKSIGSLDGSKNNDFTEYLSIAKDTNNDLWFVPYDTGVWKYDGIKITHYPVQINSKEIKLFSIYKDNKGTLWLRTHEYGLWKFNGEAFEPFRVKK